MIIDEGGCLKIKTMNIIFVLNSYDQESILRIDYISAVIQTLSKLQIINFIYIFIAEALARE